MKFDFEEKLDKKKMKDIDSAHAKKVLIVAGAGSLLLSSFLRTSTL